jgi:hypothetical protein
MDDGPPIAAGSTTEAPLASPPSDKPRKMTLKLIAFIIVGAAAGFAYYKFVGCRSGTCPITANPYISTVYGAVLGYLISGGFK